MTKHLVVLCAVALACACNRSEPELPAAASEDDDMRSMDNTDRRPTTPVTPSGDSLDTPTRDPRTPPLGDSVQAQPTEPMNTPSADTPAGTHDSTSVQGTPAGMPKQPARPIDSEADVTERRATSDDPDQPPAQRRAQQDDSERASEQAEPTGSEKRSDARAQRDREITQRIEQNLEAHNSLSLSAKNAKITTLNGRVSLSGEVETAEERRIVERIALEAAGPGNVENMLSIDEAP